MIEEYSFWSLSYYFVKEENYRILHLSKDQKEIWLENPDSKQLPIIRLINTVLDWSNWMEKDIKLTGLNGERIRKQKKLRNLHIINLYISPYTPVDDYEDRLKSLGQFDKTRVETFIKSRDSHEDTMKQLETAYNKKILLSNPAVGDITSEQIDEMQKKVILISAKREQEERDIFTYGKPLFTYIFIVIQLIIFLLLELKGGSKNSVTLVEFGAKFNPLILAGEWWRFITPIFIHIGFIHLFMNTLGLYYLGTAVEKIYGSPRFFWIYLFAGVTGSIVSFAFSPNLSAGASGAIYGCFGALLYIGLVYPTLFFRTLGKNVITILVLNIVISFTVPSIDVGGHLGGLVGGFVATGMVHFPKKKKRASQLIFSITAVLLLLAMLLYGFNKPTQLQSEHSILQLAQDYVKEEKYEQAYNLLSDHLNGTVSPSAYFYFQLSFVEIQTGMMKDAEKHLTQAIEINPHFHEAHFNLAIILLQQHELEKARLHARRAVEIDPTNKKYQEILAEID
jgi:rhomboid protease GluP